MLYYLAYLDPGTGSFLLQLLAGGLFASMFFVKRIWNQVTGLIARKPQPQPQEA